VRTGAVFDVRVAVELMESAERDMGWGEKVENRKQKAKTSCGWTG
jgi:hypothetical protein